jgi:uncharacterized membrane protein
MNDQNKKLTTTQDLQNVIGNFLRMGVILSVVIVAIGGILFLIRHANEKVTFGVFKANQAQYTSIEQILDGLLVLDSLAVVQLGVLVLIFIPIIRVILAVYSFLVQKDYLFVAIGVIILLIITCSLYFRMLH